MMTTPADDAVTRVLAGSEAYPSMDGYRVVKLHPCLLEDFQTVFNAYVKLRESSAALRESHERLRKSLEAIKDDVLPFVRNWYADLFGTHEVHAVSALAAIPPELREVPAS